MVQFASDVKKKITILGATNAGCLAALHFGFHSFQLPNIEVELIHNPEQSPEKVGQAWAQGTLLGSPRMLWDALGFNLMENPIDATIKIGVMYEDWGKKNELVLHPFPPARTAMHISPDKFHDYILKTGWFKVKEADIDNLSYDTIDSDYIIDCREKPKKLTQEDLKSGLYHVYDGHVNSVILANQPGADLRQHWTKAIATPDGWCFSIPLGDNTTSYGYLYNDKITTEEQAKVNMQERFHLQLPISMGPSNDAFQFDQYLVKDPIIDDRIMLHGDNLFFVEPLESASFAIIHFWNKKCWEWIMEGSITTKQLKKQIKKTIQQVINFQSWHYTFGSKYDTPFWNKAKMDSVLKFAKDGDIRLRHVIKLATENSPEELRHKLQFQSIWDIEYADWDVINFQFWIRGMTEKLPIPQRYPFI